MADIPTRIHQAAEVPMMIIRPATTAIPPAVLLREIMVRMTAAMAQKPLVPKEPIMTVPTAPVRDMVAPWAITAAHHAWGIHLRTTVEDHPGQVLVAEAEMINAINH